MRPEIWKPPVELSVAEQKVAKRIRKAKLFVFLRKIRHELFDPDFQRELGTIFKDSSVGLCPIAPAQLSLAIILQAYTGVSDEEAIEAIEMDRRWQLVLDCLDCEKAPFGKGTLVRFRALLIANSFDRRLIEKTIEMAQSSGEYNSRSLRVALDSSPLWGAARVEDTYNLLGHALRKALEVISQNYQQDLVTVATSAGAEVVTGTSLKAALDLDWDDPQARNLALSTILQALNSVESWVEEKTDLDHKTISQVNKSLKDARQIETQDVEETSDGSPKLRKGVAKNRRISIQDEEMRHGRKSRNKRVDGYKRHVLKDLELQMVRAVGVTPANAPEASVTPDIEEDLNSQQVIIQELQIDRAYLTSHWVKQRTPTMTIICKPWKVRNGHFFDKNAFVLDWEQHLIRCPNGVSLPFTEGSVVRFPKHECDSCPKRSQCTQSKHGRSISIHPDESLLAELRERQTSNTGRAKLRERVSVEHTLAHIGQWQGDKARYLGLRKNLFDLRRMAVVHNLHVLARMCKTNDTVGELENSTKRRISTG
ncbi:IS1182 family transposase [Mastigocoleus testarum]|uniref:Transposase n=1 Tax=Mastigocoleus testarum BC008 TaxID=371196 RepID=A0A0V7ZNQ1_9CYAN|nr:IS1182 family transposase [Mastigocoleus testarum]KST66030.1 transposase [Mastigocoleus testarum BC008]